MGISQVKKLEIITKHARKFAGKGAAAGVITGVHYAEGGAVCVTDRHKLLMIENAHSFAEPFTSDIKTGGKIDGQYPDFTRVIPADVKTEVAISDVNGAAARAKLAFDTAKLIGDKTYISKLQVDEGGARIIVSSEDGGVKYEAALSTGKTEGPPVSIYLNAQYLHEALAVFKDAGSATVDIRLTEPMAPLTLRDEVNEITAIVLPYRTPHNAKGDI